MQLLVITGIRQHWAESGRHSTPHVVIALLGCFKGEMGEKYHLMPLAAEASSGLRDCQWVGRFLDKQKQATRAVL